MTKQTTNQVRLSAAPQLTLKAILLIENQGTEVPATRNAYTVTADNMELLSAELKLIISQYLNGFHHKGQLLNNKVLYVNKSLKGGDTCTETHYVIEEEETTYRLSANGKSFTIHKEENTMKPVKTIETPITEEKVVSPEQVEFDLSVGMETSSVDETAKKVTAILMEKMEAAGVDKTNMAAVAAFMATNQKIVEELVNAENGSETQAVTTHPELNAELEGQFLEVLRNISLNGDNHIHAALMIFGTKSQENKAFHDDVLRVFGDRAAYGTYFRTALGLSAPTKSVVKTTAFVSADVFRTTGNLVETGVTAAVQAINKYVFHLVAAGIEKPVGGRPEDLKGFNYVDDTAARVWSSVRKSK